MLPVGFEGRGRHPAHGGVEQALPVDVLVGEADARKSYLFSLGAPRKISESKMKFWPEGSIMTWILSLSF